MNERDDFGAEGTPASPGARGVGTTPSGQGPERWSAGEQAGPATWSERVPGSGTIEGEGMMAGAGESGPSGVAQKAAQQASRLAHEAGQGVEEAVGRRKDQAADRIAGLASAVRDAARTLQQQDPSGFARYADTAAQQLERASGYLRERDVRGMLREVEGLARRRPELFLAGSVLVGLALARFLKSSARRSHDSGGFGSPYYAEGSYAGEESYLQESSYPQGPGEQGSYPPGSYQQAYQQGSYPQGSSEQNASPQGSPQQASYQSEGSYRTEGYDSDSPTPSPSRGTGEI